MRCPIGTGSKSATLQHIKIVLITGQATPPFLLEAVNFGVVNAALAKPVNINELQQLASASWLAIAHSPRLSGHEGGWLWQ